MCWYVILAVSIHPLFPWKECSSRILLGVNGATALIINRLTSTNCQCFYVLFQSVAYLQMGIKPAVHVSFALLWCSNFSLHRQASVTDMLGLVLSLCKLSLQRLFIMQYISITLGKRYSQTQILLRHIHFNPSQNENSQTIVGIMFGNYYDQSQKYIRPRAVISNIFTTFAPYNYISCQEIFLLHSFTT